MNIIEKLRRSELAKFYIHCLKILSFHALVFALSIGDLEL